MLRLAANSSCVLGVLTSLDVMYGVGKSKFSLGGMRAEIPNLLTLLRSLTGFPSRRSRSIIMTREEGLLERSEMPRFCIG